MSRWLSIGTIGLIVGMGFSTWVPFQASSLTLLFLVGTIISVTLFPSRTNILSSVFAFLTLFGGVTLYATHFERWQTLSETIEYRGQVEIIERRDTNVFYRPILLRPIEKTWKGGDILYSAPIDFEQIPGEQGLLDCTLSRPKNFEAGFDYRNLLASRGTGYVCEKNGEFELLSREEFSLREKIFWLQSQFRRLITELVPEPEAGLLTGLLLGGSGTLAPETKDAKDLEKEKALAAARVKYNFTPEARPETITVPQFVALFRSLKGDS